MEVLQPRPPAHERAFRAVLLDIDGTLLDSNVAHARAWAIALGEVGYDVRPRRVLRFIGMGADAMLPALCGLSRDSAAGRAAEKRSGELFDQRFLPRLRPFPEVRRLLERLQGQELMLGVATSAGRRNAHALLRQAGVADLVQCLATGDDVAHSKPAPDIVSVALEKCALTAREVVLVGDTPYDVECAARNDVACIAVRCGGWSTSALRGAIAVFDDPADILARLETRPLADWFGLTSSGDGSACLDRTAEGAHRSE